MFFLFFSEHFCLFRLFDLIVRSLVRSKICRKIVRVDAIDLVQKSSNFEPSLRFFGRLKIFYFFGLWFIMKNIPLVSNIKNIPPWSYPDAAAAGPAAATSAAASAVCI